MAKEKPFGLPATLQTGILARFMNEKDLVALYEQYKDARKHTGWLSEPTKEMEKIAKSYARNPEASFASIGKEFGITPYKAQRAVSVVSTWNFVKSLRK